MLSKSDAFSGLKRDYDKELMLKLCPPKEVFNNNTYVKTIVIDIDLIETTLGGVSLQPRELINLTDNVMDLKRSFERRGWVHGEERLFVTKSKDDPKKVTLKSGFNRHGGAKEAGWKYLPVDVYEESALESDNILFKYRANNDNLPSKPNKDLDFIKGCVEAIDKNAIENTDESIVKFLTEITKTSDGIALKTPLDIEDYTKDAELTTNCLLYKVRRQRGKTKSLMPMDGSRANKWLKDNGYGYLGDRGITSGKTDKMGYAFGDRNSFKRIFWDGMKHYIKYGLPMPLYGYVENPVSTALDQQRLDVEKRYQKFIETGEDIVRATLEDNEEIAENPVALSQLKTNLSEVFPWGGHIPQDYSQTPKGIKEKDII